MPGFLRITFPKRTNESKNKFEQNVHTYSHTQGTVDHESGDTVAAGLFIDQNKGANGSKNGYADKDDFPQNVSPLYPVTGLFDLCPDFRVLPFAQTDALRGDLYQFVVTDICYAIFQGHVKGRG